MQLPLRDKLSLAGTLPLQMSKATLLDLFDGAVKSYCTRMTYRLKVWNDGRLHVFLQAGEDLPRRAEVEYGRDGIAWLPKLLEKPKPDDEQKTKVFNDLGHPLPKGTWAWFLQSGERKDTEPVIQQA